MAKYKLKNTNILHNGELVKIGDVIELTDDQAKKLTDILVPVKETANKEKTPATKTETKTTKTSKGTKTKKEETTPAEDKKDETQKDGDNN